MIRLGVYVLFTSSTQYRIKPHLVGKFDQVERDKHLLSRIEGLLRIKDAQVAVNPICIAFI